MSTVLRFMKHGVSLWPQHFMDYNRIALEQHQHTKPPINTIRTYLFIDIDPKSFAKDHTNFEPLP